MSQRDHFQHCKFSLFLLKLRVDISYKAIREEDLNSPGHIIQAQQGKCKDLGGEKSCHIRCVQSCLPPAPPPPRNFDNRQMLVPYSWRTGDKQNQTFQIKCPKLGTILVREKWSLHTFITLEFDPPRQFQGMPLGLFITVFCKTREGEALKLFQVIAHPRDLPPSFLKAVFSELEIIPEDLPLRPWELTQNPACFRTLQNLLNASFLIGEGEATENHFDCPGWL